ncbi:MAG TPA: hypothetical protein PK685_02065 [archaeon]|nr:hypothetical protein [archaeon]
MQKHYNNIVKASLLLIFVIFFQNTIFAQNYEISGIKNTLGDTVYCNYDSGTNNCVLPGGQYIISEDSLSVNNLRPNLIISQDVNIDTNISFIPQVTVWDVMTKFYIVDFNSIIISNNKKLTIFLKNEVDIKIKTNIFINSGAEFNFKSHSEIKRCIDYLNSEESYADSYLKIATLDFSEAKIYNQGKFNLDSNNYIEPANYYSEEYAIYFPGCYTSEQMGIYDDNPLPQTLPITPLNVYSKRIIFGYVNNSGEIKLNCGAQKYSLNCDLNNSYLCVYGQNNANMNYSNTIPIDFKEPICEIEFSEYIGKLPKTITFNALSTTNLGRIYLNTCGPIEVPSGLNYTAICSLIYSRPEAGIIDLNSSNIGLQNNNIIKFTKNCNYINITAQISDYLLTDQNQTMTPIIFGNIQKANSGQTINPQFTYIGDNFGLFDINYLEYRYSSINNQTTQNGFFIFNLTPNSSKILDIIKMYQFKFKLNENIDLNYSDVNLYYPFKIYK